MKHSIKPFSTIVNMKTIIMLVLLAVVAGTKEGIDLSLCSDDRTYCYDHIHGMIRHVGSDSIAPPFGVSTQTNDTYGGVAVYSDINPKVTNSFSSLSVVPAVKYKYSMGNKMVAAPECGLEHSAAECKVVSIGAATPTVSKAVVAGQPYLVSTPSISAPVEGVKVPPAIVSIPETESSLAVDPCDEAPIVTHTPTKVCYSKPQKKYLTVNCCKTTRIPIKEKKTKIPCICADGTPAARVIPEKEPQLEVASGNIAIADTAVTAATSAAHITPAIQIPVQTVNPQVPQLENAHAYMNWALNPQNRSSLIRTPLNTSEEDKLIVEQDRNYIIRASRQL
ncbi:hypothetical protein NEAUS07_2106 [Nematocida ausubeli]|nr:hypothetical protein NEAUS07_2106 [Nematocida ausubeli]